MPTPLLHTNANHLKEIYNAMKSGNPMQIFNNIAAQNPNMKPIMQMINNGSNPKALFYQMCKQQGINPDEFIKRITG